MIIGIIGGICGIIAAGAGIWVAIWATGAMEYTGGKLKSRVEPIGKLTLKKQILSLNSPDMPYQIKPSDKSDLEIEWKIVDAHWLGIFAREQLKETYRACLALDELKHTVRYWEAIDRVEWVAGAPKVHYSSEFFRGKIIYQKSAGVQYGIMGDKTLGKIYEYKFDIKTIREPIKQAALKGGWEFVEVLRKRNTMKV
jgi:hypothetical protein